MKPFATLLQQNRLARLELAPGQAEAILRAAALTASDQEREAFRKQQANLLYEALQP